MNESDSMNEWIFTDEEIEHTPSREGMRLADELEKRRDTCLFLRHLHTRMQLYIFAIHNVMF